MNVARDELMHQLEQRVLLERWFDRCMREIHLLEGDWAGTGRSEYAEEARRSLLQVLPLALGADEVWKDSDPLALNGRSGYVFGIIARRCEPEPFGNGMDEWLENVQPMRPVRWEAHS